MSTKPTSQGFKCLHCKREGYTTSSFSHPIWVDDEGNTQFSIPDELQDLREGEKLLIQQVSPYVPLQHLQKGSYGCKGHVCSFPQDIHSLCTILPRLPSDVTLVNVVKSFRDKQNVPHKLTFRIRKQKVLAALRWLVKYNTEYSNITIKESNLEWMSEEEEDLPQPVTNDADESEQSDSEAESTSQYCNIHDDPDPAIVTPPVYGYLQTPSQRHNPQQKNKQTTDILQQAHDINISKTTNVDFPYISESPINEFDVTEKLFCKAFPWLFPGGRGDINDPSQIKETADQWLKRLLYFQDGRFARDKIWAFFALSTML